MRALLILFFLLSLTAPVAAGEFEDGMAAYGREDYESAFQLWQPLAEQGDAPAQFNLGVMYSQSHGVPQDYVEAMKWYRRAAEQGYAPAQFNLGNMYNEGHGVPQDYVQAHMWLNLAASQGSDKGRRNRDLAAAKMTPDQIAEAQRLAREWKPK